MSMIFRIYNSVTKNSNNSQDGVSLMLSVLVLAAITAISFSLATIVFVELRASGDVVRSEPALYATLGVTEEALFQYKRFVNDREDGSTVNPPLLDVVGCEPDITVCELGGVAFSANSDIQLLDEDINPRLQTIYAGEDTVIPLYGAADDFGAQYGLVTLQIVPADHNYDLDVSLRSISESGNVPQPQSWSLSEGVLMLRNEMNIDGFQHDLIITNNTPENFLVEIRSYDTDGTTEKGLPFIGRKVLKVIANYLGITRNYWVNIPTGSAGGGADQSATDTIYVGDSPIPNGGSPVGVWNWISSNPAPFSGSSAHTQGLTSGNDQHYFYGASSTMAVSSGDRMVTYVYIDPANVPREIMIQWGSETEGWNHRAYWGENLIGYGTDGTTQRRYMGAIPATGQWVRLEVPASAIGLEGRTVNAMAFTQYDGLVTWDHSGKE